MTRPQSALGSAENWVLHRHHSHCGTYPRSPRIKALMYARFIALSMSINERIAGQVLSSVQSRSCALAYEFRNYTTPLIRSPASTDSKTVRIASALCGQENSALRACALPPS